MFRCKNGENSYHSDASANAPSSLSRRKAGAHRSTHEPSHHWQAVRLYDYLRDRGDKAVGPGFRRDDKVCGVCEHVS
jgi:hypothetical protein